MTLLRRLATASLSLCALAAGLVAQIVVDDALQDTDRIGGFSGATATTTSSPVVGTATAINTQWVCNKQGTNLVASATGLNWLQSGTSNNLATAYFPVVSLATTGTVKLTVNFTTGAAGGTTGQLALSFVDGSPAGYRTTDGVGSTDATYVGDLGYRINVGNFGGGSTAQPTIALLSRTTTTSNDLLGTSGNWTAFGATVTAASGSFFQASTAYTLELTLKKLSAANVELTATITGGNLSGLTVTRNDTTGNLWNNFDQFSLRLAGGANQFASLNLTRFRVDLTSLTGPVAPAITTQPLAQNVIVGDPVTFTVGASGTAPLSYQWRKDTVALDSVANPSASTATLSLTNVQLADIGGYDCVVTNSVSSATSNAAALGVAESPDPTLITQQPAPVSVAQGGTASFTVAASGTSPITYAWRKNTVVISGNASASTPTLTLTNAQPVDAADYDVVVTGRGGAVTSNAATLTVIPPPVINTPPQNLTVLAGNPASFTVAATGASPLTYQWRKGGTAIVGNASATTATLSIPVTTLADAGSYDVVVTGNGGSTTSSAATLTVNAPPAITAQPASQAVLVGANVTFSVGVSGTAPFSYEWRKGGSTVGTGATLTLNNAQESDSGSFDVVVTNAFGFTTSNAATLTVQANNAVDLYAAPDGVAGAIGTIEFPTTLTDAITRLQPGGTIWLRGGTYVYAVQVTIERTNSGTSDQLLKRIFAYGNELPVLDFSSQPYGTGTNPRGLQINGHYWHVRGLTARGSADNGIYVAGNHNTIERCVTHSNRDTGLQIGRYASTALHPDWPAYNLILNCESYDNYDAPPGGGENADGFACKLTSGPGNVFRGCVSHHNIDDGWDLFTKADTGAIDPVVLDQCIAYSNGTLTNGTSSSSGDRNGFKLGGTDIAVAHVVTRCIAFANGKNGFTWNSNPGPILVANCTAWNNAQGNFKFDNTSTAIFRNDVSLWTSGSGTNDRYGGNSGAPTGATNCFWFNGAAINAAGLVANTADFVTFTPPATWTRFANGDLDLGTFAKLVAGSDLINKGEIPPGTLPFDAASYYDGLPDLGARENQPPAVAPSITTHPLSQSVEVGSPLTLTVAANGTAPFTYQWRKNIGAIGGATNASFSIGTVLLADAGSYDVVVTNAVSSATSNTAVITVTQNYANWAAGYGLGAGSGSDDTDGDGLNNLAEYALNLSPLVANTIGAPTLTLEGGQYVFRFTRPKWTTGLTYTVQVSTDLASWSPSPSAPVVESSTATTETLVVTLDASVPRRFARLLITSP